MVTKKNKLSKTGINTKAVTILYKKKPFVEFDGNGFSFAKITQHPTKMDSSEKLTTQSLWRHKKIIGPLLYPGYAM